MKRSLVEIFNHQLRSTELARALGDEQEYTRTQSALTRYSLENKMSLEFFYEEDEESENERSR